MLRLASKRIFSQNKIATRALSSAVAESSATAGPPSVFDSIVKLNFVDPSGARRTIPAYVGKYILYNMKKCVASSSVLIFFPTRKISLRDM